MRWLRKWHKPYHLEMAGVDLGNCLMYELSQVVNGLMRGDK